MAPPPPSLSVSGKEAPTARARPKRRLHQARGSDDDAGRRKAPRLVHGEEGAPPRYNFPVIDPTADDGAALVPGVHASPGLGGQYGQMYDSGGGSPGFIAKNGEDERSRGQAMDLDREFAKNGEDELSRGQGLDLDLVLNREFAKNGEDELSRGQGLDLDLDLNREFAKNGKELIPNAGKEEAADAAVSGVHTGASGSDVDKKRTNAELLWELKCDLFEEYDVMLVLLERISVLTEDLRYCSEKVTAAKKDEIAAAWKSIRDHRTVCSEIIQKTRQAKGIIYPIPEMFLE